LFQLKKRKGYFGSCKQFFEMAENGLPVKWAAWPKMDVDYYPFGLTMAGISSKAAGKLENKRKWNAGSELESKEFSDGSGLDLYATEFRTIDPQVGRFLQIDPLADEEGQEKVSPYHFALNNPIRYNDPTGKCIPCIPFAIEFIVAAFTPEAVVAGGAAVAITAVSLNPNFIRDAAKANAELAVSTGTMYMPMGFTSIPVNLNMSSKASPANALKTEPQQQQQPAKQRSASDQKLIDEAKQQKAKQDASETRDQQRQQQSAYGKEKEGKSNQGTAGSHDSGSKSAVDKQKHDKAEARRAREQAAADK
jgi:RHS repeat-associated protein